MHPLGKFGHKKADCWDLKNKKEKHPENKKKVQKDKSKVRFFKCGKLGYYANECKNDKASSGDDKHVTFAMICYVNSEEDKMGMGMMITSKNQRILKMMKEKRILEQPGTLKNPKKLHWCSSTYITFL